LNIKCGSNYPQQPPEISFNSKINLPIVNQSNGKIETNKFSMFANWRPEYTMEKILIGIKSEMIANKKLPQPAEGDMF
jgi:ubiquitin-conjugating enzyme E2 variant